jgi:hypothetical protein
MASRMQLAYLALSFALVGLGMATGLATTAHADSSVSVTVHANTSLGTLPATAFGINAAVWDGHLLDANLPGLLQQAGVKVVRYPGGSTADVYHWQTNSTEPGQSFANPNNTFDAFMGVVQQTGAQAMITVNYGSGTPQEAAGWVQYANKGGPGYTGPVPTYPGASSTGHTYGITYWEIGNEVYGNGTYGANFEYDLHMDKGPVAYGENALQFIDAMKAVDPSIKVGVALTAPGNWPDEDVLGNAGTPQAWNDNVLEATCSALDFADVHWYPQDPGKESDANLLQAPEQGIAGRTDSIPQMVARLRQEISQYCPSRASQIQIMLTETNSVSYNPGKQTVSVVNALYLDDNYMTWLEQGVATVAWWDTHNGPMLGTNDGPALYGTATYGDFGVLATGDTPEPPAETPFPPYYGLQMLTKLGVAGDQMVAATSSSSLVAVHAVKQANGNLAVLLINKDPATFAPVTLFLCNFTPALNPMVYAYGPGSTAISAVRQPDLAGAHVQRPGRGARTKRSPALLVIVPPYSVVTIVMTPAPDLD